MKNSDYEHFQQFLVLILTHENLHGSKIKNENLVSFQNV